MIEVVFLQCLPFASLGGIYTSVDPNGTDEDSLPAGVCGLVGKTNALQVK